MTAAGFLGNQLFRERRYRSFNGNRHHDPVANTTNSVSPEPRRIKVNPTYQARPLKTHQNTFPLNPRNSGGALLWGDGPATLAMMRSRTEQKVSQGKMPWRRLLLLLVACLVGAGALMVWAFDAERFRGIVEARFEKALGGRDVRLGGLKLSFRPVLGLRIDDVAVARLPAEGEGDLMTAQRVRLGARIGPLLDKRLEVTAIVVQEPELTLERDASGRWNIEQLLTPASEPLDSAPATATSPASPPSESIPFSVDRFRVSDGRLHLGMAATGDTEPLRTTLADLDVTVRDFGIGRRSSFEASGTFEDTSARFQLSGNAPYPMGTEDRDPDWDIALEIEGLTRPVVRPWARFGGLDLELPPDTNGTLEIAIRPVDDSLEARGQSRWTALRLAPEGKPFELAVEFDLGLHDSGERIVVNGLRLSPDGHALQLHGAVDTAEPRIDLTLPATQLSADQIVYLVSLTGGAPGLDLQSEYPLELAGQLNGSMADGRSPQLTGTAILRGVTLEHPSLADTLRALDAQVEMAGEELRIRNLRANLSDSEIAGELIWSGFESPQVQFELSSPEADVGKLLGLFESGDPAEDAAPSQDLGDLSVVGRLQLAKGVWEGMGFEELEGNLQLTQGLLTLEPLSFDAYGGTFNGRIALDLTVEPSAYQITGATEDLDLAPFLADTLGLVDAVHGRVSGDLGLHGTVSDSDPLKTLEGGGHLKISEGRVGRLNVLRSVSRVAGVLGQRTVEGLTQRLAEESTRFDLLEGTFHLTAGQLDFEPLRLLSPEFDLDGTTRLALDGSRLAGDFRMLFSPATSAMMRREGSRAADVFWDPKSSRIALPLALGGTIPTPRASVDWKGATRDLVQRTAQREILDFLGRTLGGERGESARNSEQPPPPRTVDEPPSPVGQSAGAPAMPTGLRVEITETRWRGSVLFQDLEVTGRIVGSGVRDTSLILLDADGRELDRIAPLTGQAEAPSQGQAETLRFTARVDGKRLLLARFPLTVVVSAKTSNGEHGEVRREVNPR